MKVMEKEKLRYDLSMCHTVPIEHLRVGDIFFEDTCSEVYEVTGNHIDDDFGQEMTDVKLVGYLDGCKGDPSKIGNTDSFALISVELIQRRR